MQNMANHLIKRDCCEIKTGPSSDHIILATNRVILMFRKKISNNAMMRMARNIFNDKTLLVF